MKIISFTILLFIYQSANASWLTDLSSAFGTSVGETMAERQNTRIEVVSVNHQGQQVTFSHQIWKIKPDTVCAQQRDSIGRYSKCTQAAKSVFIEFCKFLQENPKPKNWKYPRLTNMYCNAANTYKPTVAQLEASPGNTALEQVRQDCSLATVEAMNNYDAAAVKKRDQLCKKYRDMKK